MSFHLIHGSDYFRLQRAQGGLFKRLGLEKGDVTRFDGLEHPPTPSELYHAAFSGSLFGPSGAVQLSNAGAWIKWAFKTAKEVDPADLATLHDLTHAPADITVIFSDFNGTVPKMPSKVWKEINEGAEDRQLTIDPLKFIPYATNGELERLISDLAKEHKGLTMDAEAIRRLSWRCGSDLGIVAAELIKYADWAAAHPGERVTAALIETETPAVVDIFIFDLIDAIAARNLQKALLLLTAVMQGGEAPPKILVLIHRQYKLMFWALMAQAEREGNLAKRLGVPDWQVKRLLGSARGYERRQLPSVLRLLAETDRALKTSQMPQELTMELLVTRICRM